MHSIEPPTKTMHVHARARCAYLDFPSPSCLHNENWQQQQMLLAVFEKQHLIDRGAGFRGAGFRGAGFSPPSPGGPLASLVHALMMHINACAVCLGMQVFCLQTCSYMSLSQANCIRQVIDLLDLCGCRRRTAAQRSASMRLGPTHARAREQSIAAAAATAVAAGCQQRVDPGGHVGSDFPPTPRLSRYIYDSGRRTFAASARAAKIGIGLACIRVVERKGVHASQRGVIEPSNRCPDKGWASNQAVLWSLPSMWR